MTCPNCKDTGWVEVPGIMGLDDPATTFEICDCAAGGRVGEQISREAVARVERGIRDEMRSLLDHATRSWAKLGVEHASDAGDYGTDILAAVNEVRARSPYPLVVLDREEALSYGEGGG